MKNIVVSFTQRNPFSSLLIMFICIIIYQSLNVFWGFELLDSGFHLTAFENIFDAPDSISYNFMYYLTNVIGGGIMYVFPSIGVVGFRIVGALFVDLSLLLIFFCLRKEIPVIHLLIGGVLVVISYIQIPYSFNNGICSCFFYVCALLLIYKGLVNGKALFIFLSGVIVGVNVFSRIPNVLAIGLVLIILFHKYVEESKLEYDWKSTSFFLCGFGGGIVIMVILIILLGHQQAFIDALYVLFNQATGPLESSNGHSLGDLIWTQFYFYLSAIIFVALFFTVYVVYHLVENSFWKYPFLIIASFTIFYYVYLNFGYKPLWAMCVIGCCLCFNRGGKLALLSLLALFLLFVEILGSGGGTNHGSLPALMAAPIASYTLLNKRNLIFVIVACIALFMKVIKQGNYFDFGPLSLKNSSIKVEECSMIRTTAERAEALNVTIPALKQYILPKDTLFVYKSAPMMNYLTHTRPAGGTCWPALGSIGSFVTAPKILIQKSDGFTIPTQPIHVLPTGNKMIDTYMHDHQYKIVWENPYFILLFPQK